MNKAVDLQEAKGDRQRGVDDVLSMTGRTGPILFKNGVRTELLEQSGVFPFPKQSSKSRQVNIQTPGPPLPGQSGVGRNIPRSWSPRKKAVVEIKMVGQGMD